MYASSSRRDEVEILSAYAWTQVFAVYAVAAEANYERQ